MARWVRFGALIKDNYILLDKISFSFVNPFSLYKSYSKTSVRSMIKNSCTFFYRAFGGHGSCYYHNAVGKRRIFSSIVMHVFRTKPHRGEDNKNFRF